MPHFSYFVFFYKKLNFYHHYRLKIIKDNFSFIAYFCINTDKMFCNIYKHLYLFSLGYFIYLLVLMGQKITNQIKWEEIGITIIIIWQMFLIIRFSRTKHE
jgi:hypothetical protein